MRMAGLGTVLAATLLGTPTHCYELYSYFEQSDDPPQTSITVSPCTGDEIVAECVSHALSCSKAPESRPEFKIYLQHFETIVPSVINDITGYGKAELQFAGGDISLSITSVVTSPLGMDGGWVATIGIDGGDNFLQALTEKNSEDASLVIAGKRFPLAPQKGDGDKLVAWKNACIALEGQSLPEAANAPAKSDLETLAEMVKLLTKDVARAGDLLEACENTYRPSSEISLEESIYNTIRCEDAIQFGFTFTNFIYELSGNNTPKVCWKEPRNRRERADTFVKYLRSIEGIGNYSSASILYAFSVDHYKCDASGSAK